MVGNMRSRWKFGFRLTVGLLPVVALFSLLLLGCQTQPAKPTTAPTTPNSAIPDLIAANDAEILILSKYLPAGFDAAKLEALITAAIASTGAQ